MVAHIMVRWLAVAATGIKQLSPWKCGMTSSEISSSSGLENCGHDGSNGLESKKQERLYKVAFDLPDEVARWAPGATERMWVEKTSVKMEVRLKNVPFYFRGLSFGDVLCVVVDHGRRELVFDKFVAESGHSTLRFIVGGEESARILSEVLERHGCSWEIDSSGILWAVDVPPEVDYLRLKYILNGVSQEFDIGYEEGALSSVHVGRV